MDYSIRELKPNEYFLLKDFLYEAIFQKDKDNLLPRSILEKPELQIYIDKFGKLPDDYCLCADISGKVVGVVWARIINGYGSLDSQTPELAISVYDKYRGKQIGQKLLEQMLSLLQSKHYKKVALAVQKENRALSLYKRVGFKIVGENDEEYLMSYALQERG
ncbi:ribosomal protein S18 acetylase RimI-like enzyme [Breznakia sp. PF5-3]|uniref:GNAT family N-acetyltransferase n=1 Tax=unclassified Breznakia TaxID=2623764 RepID=UPI0024050C23|nr:MULTISPECIES: GNAT family N-acetyltransferase [unclassified Breznakia]MDF9824498.1 ribosomal protein S18 acetylase RimI-like enzyme [Breznakia sp. PM6-1]MDF9835284.1 ribosomal protein S18 acetylase RimI-like enzyme [Breznakia sp. PF5-3]MDF9837000.1 ribosomal protein S18 acetylase RimI-like enzyme [Breznakia sp. PFB2-8]MDF9858925.1 ribosomal protein S18 acetylase RimI-like enzyme [Breznakia sp. PH5-24]